MSSFGKRAGGGRRSASREVLPLPAVVSTIDENRTVELVDLSATGARLRAERLPPAGESLWVKIDTLGRFALVVWTDEDECGIEFDVPIHGHEVRRLRQEVQIAIFVAGSMQKMLAMQDWQTGFAR